MQLRKNQLILLRIGCGLALLFFLAIGYSLYCRRIVPCSKFVTSRENIRDIVYISGEVRPRRTVNITPMITAEIQQIYVKNGQFVKQGEKLLSLNKDRLKQTEIQSELNCDITRKEVQNSTLALNQQERIFAAKKRLFNEGLISNEDFNQAELLLKLTAQNLEKARLLLKQAESQVMIAREDIEKTDLYSPIDGVVSSLQAEKGEIAFAGQATVPGVILMTISDTTGMVIQTQVGEHEIDKLSIGQYAEILIEALGDEIITGAIESISAIADKAKIADSSQKYSVTLSICDSNKCLNRMKAGMGARISILCKEKKDAIVVPIDLVFGETRKSGVMGLTSRDCSFVILNSNGYATRQAIQTGIVSGKNVEVLSGLKEGDSIMVAPQKDLISIKNGQKIGID